MQQIIEADNQYKQLDEYLLEKRINKILLVCGKSMGGLKIGKYFEGLEEKTGIQVVRFSNFKPNPLYESVAEGVKVYRKEQCDCIVAVGGGSAMDVAKCIKLFAYMDENENYLQQKIVPNDIPFIAVPTTAGTGSEVTRFAIIYYNGEKQSVSDYSCIPSAVVMDPSVLETLPEYQKKATMMDALCHATESFWSVSATEESQKYAAEAIRLVLENKDGYLANTKEGNAGMLKAANIAGKAINITRTTAGHAMCYKLTSLYGISHGHAVALCVSALYPYMVQNTERCIDPRGEEYLKEMFTRLADAYGCEGPMAANSMESAGPEAASSMESAGLMAAANKFNEILKELNLEVPVPKEADYEILKNSVNPQRLQNNPVGLDAKAIDDLYHQML